MVGILLSYWVSAYFQGRTVSFREGKCSVGSLGQVRTAQMPTISLGVSQDYHIFRPLPTNEQQKYTGLKTNTPNSESGSKDV